MNSNASLLNENKQLSRETVRYQEKAQKLKKEFELSERENRSLESAN